MNSNFFIFLSTEAPIMQRCYRLVALKVLEKKNKNDRRRKRRSSLMLGWSDYKMQFTFISVVLLNFRDEFKFGRELTTAWTDCPALKKKNNKKKKDKPNKMPAQSLFSLWSLSMLMNSKQGDLTSCSCWRLQSGASFINLPHAASHTKVVVYKNKVDRKMCTPVSKLTRVMILKMKCERHYSTHNNAAHVWFHTCSSGSLLLTCKWCFALTVYVWMWVWRRQDEADPCAHISKLIWDL